MLIKLLLLRLKGGIRLRLRELKTLRGLLFLLLMISIITLLMNQSALPENTLDSLLPNDNKPGTGQIARFMPIALLLAYLLTLFTSSGSAIHFNPTEINMLFSGPFSRPALLLYKMCFFVFGALLSSLLIMLLNPSFTSSPLTAFLGSFLTMLFIQLFSAVSRLFGQFVTKHFNTKIRATHLFTTLIILFVVFVWCFVDISSGLTGAITQFQSSIIGTLILAPFNVYVHVFLAQSIFPDLLSWATLGLVINLVLLTIVIFLDTQSCEASVNTSLKLHKRWARSRHGGLFWSTQPTVVHSLIQPPVLNGIGPIAWRQFLAAFRCSGKILLVFLIIAVASGPILKIASADMATSSLISAVFFATVFMLPRTLVFDFRSDLHIMENFKSLPLSALKIGIGQLISPVVLTSLIELALLSSIAIFLDDSLHDILMAVCAFLVPFNLLLYGLENLFFLLFPAPLVPVGRADFDFLGRTMIGFTATTSVLIASTFIAVIAGKTGLSLLGGSWFIFLCTAWLSFTLIALSILPMLSWAFNRFDISKN